MIKVTTLKILLSKYERSLCFTFLFLVCFVRLTAITLGDGFHRIEEISWYDLVISDLF